MIDRLITQLKDTPNRLKITPRNTLAVIYLDAAFLEKRGYFRLHPVGEWDTFQHFWDIWSRYKSDLKGEGVSVKKESGRWVIHYKPLRDIELDESITGFPTLGDDIRNAKR